MANSSEIAKKSSKLSFVEAAALPIAYITSLQSLRDYGATIYRGKKILTASCSRKITCRRKGPDYRGERWLWPGGIASTVFSVTIIALCLLLIQLAKGMEAQSIVGVCSGKNEAIVLENGATEVIDYTKVKPRKVCHCSCDEKSCCIALWFSSYSPLTTSLYSSRNIWR